MIRSGLAAMLYSAGKLANRLPVGDKLGDRLHRAAVDLIDAPDKQPWSGSSRIIRHWLPPSSPDTRR